MRNSDALERLAADFGTYRQASEKQQQDLKSHFEKLEAQMQTLIETSKIRNEDQARTQGRHEESMKEIKDLTLALDKTQTEERKAVDGRVQKIEKELENMDGSLKVWKILGTGAGALLVAALVYLFNFTWSNDRGQVQDRDHRPTHSRTYEDEDRRP